MFNKIVYNGEVLDNTINATLLQFNDLVKLDPSTVFIDMQIVQHNTYGFSSSRYTVVLIYSYDPNEPVKDPNEAERPKYIMPPVTYVTAEPSRSHAKAR